MTGCVRCRLRNEDAIGEGTRRDGMGLRCCGSPGSGIANDILFCRVTVALVNLWQSVR